VTALVVVGRDEVRKDSHHNNGRDPDQYVTDKEERRKPVTSPSSQFHNFEVGLSGMSERERVISKIPTPKTAGSLGIVALQ
jgi:hypothetical protein